MGGVAAAVAGRLMLGGVGTDTGASVRLPAALCGVVGFRPTVGRYPTDGIVPVSPTRDTPGVIAQNVPDVILLDGIICGRPPVNQTVRLKGLRIGLPTAYFYNDLEPDVALAAETIIRVLARKDVTFVEADIPDLAHHNEGVSFPTAIYEFPLSLEHYIQNFVEGVSFSEVVRAIRSPDVASILNAQLSDNLISKSEYCLARRFFRPRTPSGLPQLLQGASARCNSFPNSSVDSQANWP